MLLATSFAALTVGSLWAHAGSVGGPRINDADPATTPFPLGMIPHSPPASRPALGPYPAVADRRPVPVGIELAMPPVGMASDRPVWSTEYRQVYIPAVVVVSGEYAVGQVPRMRAATLKLHLD